MQWPHAKLLASLTPNQQAVTNVGSKPMHMYQILGTCADMTLAAER